MTKTATAKKTAKTAPASNRANPALAPDNPKKKPSTQDAADVAQPMPRHNEKAPSGSQPAAATKPRTQGDSRTAKTVPTPSVRAPSPSSCRSHSSSRRNRARDANPSRDDTAAMHPSPFKFLPRRQGHEASAAGRSTPRPRTPENQGSMSRACQAGPSRRDNYDHTPSFRDVETVQSSCRSSPGEGRRQSNKGKVWHVSPQQSQPARPAEQHGQSSRRRATPEPITAQVSQRARDQAQRVLHLMEAGTQSREQDASGGTFSISTAAMLKLLTDEFSNDDPEDGRYATRQRRQESE
jgi:hypothetical protein